MALVEAREIFETKPIDVNFRKKRAKKFLQQKDADRRKQEHLA